MYIVIIVHTASLFSAPAPVETPSEDAPKPVQKYVPPGARAGSGAAGPTLDPVKVGTGRTPMRRKGTAPNLMSEDDFPTLGGESGAADSSG